MYGRGDLGRSAAYYSTDLNIDHKYKFGRDNRITIQPYVNILNLFDRKSETGVVETITTSTVSNGTLLSGGCAPTTCVDMFSAMHLVTGGAGITQYVNSWLAANPAARKYNVYGLSSGFSAPREVRFGARLYF